MWLRKMRKRESVIAEVRKVFKVFVCVSITMRKLGASKTDFSFKKLCQCKKIQCNN